jgi:hypothetical protein
MATGERISAGLGLLVRPEENQGSIGPSINRVGHPRSATSGSGSSLP